ncbi:hypothetical protein BDI4_500020 [Burkholderia diffusa]|nr:hypothetical protein BDI4_500020 [Burkholderia diffusa]
MRLNGADIDGGNAKVGSGRTARGRDHGRHGTRERAPRPAGVIGAPGRSGASVGAH